MSRGVPNGTPFIFLEYRKLNKKFHIKEKPLTHYRVSGLLNVAIYSPYTYLQHTDAPYDT